MREKTQVKGSRSVRTQSAEGKYVRRCNHMSPVTVLLNTTGKGQAVEKLTEPKKPSVKTHQH